MPDASVSYEKATFVKVVAGALTGDKVVCHFNPETLGIDYAVRWDKRMITGQAVPQLTYVGGHGRTLNLRDLLFDTTKDGTDVRDQYKMLLDLASPDTAQQNAKTTKSEPDGVQFQWGKFLAFNAVITSVTQNFIMFNKDGTPLRCKINVTLAEMTTSTPAQNPTSRSLPRKTHIVHEGETLDWIAYKEYSDPACWRFIAESNDLADPKKLFPGQVLRLPPLT